MVLQQNHPNFTIFTVSISRLPATGPEPSKNEARKLKNNDLYSATSAVYYLTFFIFLFGRPPLAGDSDQNIYMMEYG